VLQDVNPF